MKKTFDAVKIMRAARRTLSMRYAGNAELEEKDLNEVRRKYGFWASKNISKKHAATEVSDHDSL